MSIFINQIKFWKNLKWIFMLLYMLVSINDEYGIL